ncbi:hypothetical protein KEM09_02085 [Carboxylicivirga mesophila]|uniref:Calx-beta domain-containing protein n=1 Tax=Carboxylicivirga mesophila TaxID=1166478 RepID=A0ABS5K5B2_9BACT|nr:Calx-beta domain-containing protein [Carboxylicivirga mesophila]MBS2210169.1 hypothetical protein [Carboxylicivirga mesophila]
MNYIVKYIFLAIIALLVVACGEADKQLFDDQDAYFAFEAESASISENSEDRLDLSLYIAKSKAIGTVVLEADSEGLDNPAIEGVDFEIVGDETITFRGEYFQEVSIKVMDNDETDGDKQFYLTMVSNDINADLGLADGKQSKVLVTIIDDEHPLASVLGSYTLNYDSPWNGNGQQEVNQIFSVEGSDTEVGIVLGYYRDNEDFALSTKVKGTVDLEAMTVSIAYGQQTYNDGTNVLTMFGDDETPGGIITEGYLIGDIDPVTGDIVFRNPFAIAFTGGPNEGYYEDLYINPVLKK